MNRGFYVRVWVVILSVLAAWTMIWPSIPRIAPPWIQKLVKSRINLGLDIKGGGRLTFDIEVGTAIAQRRDRALDSLREQVARDLQIKKTEGRLSQAEIDEITKHAKFYPVPDNNRQFVVDFTADKGNAGRVSSDLLQRFGLYESNRSDGVITVSLSQNEVEQLEESSVKEAIHGIENRVDEIGVRELSVRAQGTETIVVEAPGHDKAYFENLKGLIQQQAHLEFRLCVDDSDMLKKLTEGQTLPDGITAIEEPNVSVGADGSGNELRASPVMLQAKGPNGRRALEQWIKAHNDSFQNLDVLIGESRETAASMTPVADENRIWRTYVVERVANVTGDMIQSAVAQPRQDTNEWYVGLEFRADGTEAFAKVTTENRLKRFAIVLDNRVVSAPNINEPITSGNASITSAGPIQQQMKQANELAMVLRAGALPAPLGDGTLSFIGPTLGKDQIRSALLAAAIGIGLVLLFMAIWYGSAGLIADISVLFNLLVQLAIMVLIGATLTLPGFAGLALTVGMAVDSNVLINERIKDELRAGKSLRDAVDAGYRNAFTAIFDGHVTTFISGVVLYQYGNKPIQGFAVLLIVGIITNLFTGVFATRVVFDWLVKGLKLKKLSLG